LRPNKPARMRVGHSTSGLAGRAPLLFAITAGAFLLSLANGHAAHSHPIRYDGERSDSMAGSEEPGNSIDGDHFHYASSTVEQPHHAGGHDCVFDKIHQTVHKDHSTGRRLADMGHTVSPQEYGQIEDSHGRKLQNTNYQKMRLVVDTSLLEPNADSFACSAAGSSIQYTLAASSNEPYSCTAADVLDATKRAFIRDSLIPAAVDFLTFSLGVIPVQGNLINNNPLPDGSCFSNGGGYWYSLVCCNQYWPSQYKNPGVANADYLLVLTTRPTKGNLLAWATECQSDQYYRPISGQANLSPAKVSTDASQFQYQLSIITHEIMHALGFNNEKLYYFRQPGSMSQAAAYSSVVFNGYDNLLQKDVSKVITPKVVAAAKAHYGCYDNWINPGMELEDGGSGGTRGSHWEKRLMMYDIMNGVSELVMYKSAITLAWFEDSGWYSGELLLWLL
jgi:Leishmanolysin